MKVGRMLGECTENNVVLRSDILLAGIPLHLIAYYLNGSSDMKPVGHFGIHTKFDYERATSIKSFDIGANCIDIGRYGPFRKQDRKVRTVVVSLNVSNAGVSFLTQTFLLHNLQPEDLFVLKTFVFSQLPSEYSFSVSEKLYGQVQNIDISSDVDGTPHDIARSEIPMYGKNSSSTR